MASSAFWVSLPPNRGKDQNVVGTKINAVDVPNASYAPVAVQFSGG